MNQPNQPSPSSKKPRDPSCNDGVYRRRGWEWIFEGNNSSQKSFLNTTVFFAQIFTHVMAVPFLYSELFAEKNPPFRPTKVAAKKDGEKKSGVFWRKFGPGSCGLTASFMWRVAHARPLMDRLGSSGKETLVLFGFWTYSRIIITVYYSYHAYYNNIILIIIIMSYNTYFLKIHILYTLGDLHLDLCP